MLVHVYVYLSQNNFQKFQEKYMQLELLRRFSDLFYWFLMLEREKSTTL